MVGVISNISIPTPSYSAADYGKMALPVESSALIYSHFEHVLGVPAPEGTNGVAISKLNLLDVLIGQLNRIRSDSFAESFMNSVEDMDAMIENLKTQIKQAQAVNEAMPYMPSPIIESGVIFSLLS